MNDYESIINNSKKAYSDWKKISVNERINYLKKIRNYIVENKQEIIDVIKKDTNKPDVECIMSDIFPTLNLIKYYENKAKKFLKKDKRKTPFEFFRNYSYVEYEPYGSVLVISPWNYPFYLSMAPTITALVSGNSVVLKPSEVNPNVGKLIKKIFNNICLKKDVFQLALGDGNVGEKLIESKPNKIFFTGSVNTGKKIMKKASDDLIPVELELGGKDAMVVFDDVDLDRVAEGALYGGFANLGQLCVGVERVFIQNNLYDDFIEKILNRIKDLNFGSKKFSDIGPFISPKQKEIVKSQINDAIKKGAKCHNEFVEKDDYIFPLVLSNVSSNMDVMKNETFGPILPIIKFNTKDEVIKLVNNSEFGLGASIWTKNIKKAKEIVSELNVGNCYINDVIKNVANPDLPFGGNKNSGIGRYHGKEGIMSFVQKKSVMVSKNRLKEINWFPYDKKTYKLLDKIINIKFKESRLHKKLSDIIYLIKNMFS